MSLVSHKVSEISEETGRKMAEVSEALAWPNLFGELLNAGWLEDDLRQADARSLRPDASLKLSVYRCPK